MDTVIEDHLRAWVRRHVPEEDFDRVYLLMFRFAEEHPDLVDRGWTAVRELAERT